MIVFRESKRLNLLASKIMEARKPRTKNLMVKMCRVSHRVLELCATGQSARTWRSTAVKAFGQTGLFLLALVLYYSEGTTALYG